MYLPPTIEPRDPPSGTSTDKLSNETSENKTMVALDVGMIGDVETPVRVTTKEVLHVLPDYNNGDDARGDNVREGQTKENGNAKERASFEPAKEGDINNPGEEEDNADTNANNNHNVDHSVQGIRYQQPQDSRLYRVATEIYLDTLFI